MIDIKSLNRAIRTKRRYSAVISVEDPGRRWGLRFHRKPHPDHLVLRFEDIDGHDPELAGPDLHHVEQAVLFAREYSDRELMIHCHAGVCRSTALGLAIISDRLGAGHETKAVEMLLATNPNAVPNLIMISMADRLLTRDGALVEAWAAAERSNGAIAEYRAKKAVILATARHLFARRPETGFYSAVRSSPDRLDLSPV
jgi:predicted protein tyrosine phosphatase